MKLLQEEHKSAEELRAMNKVRIAQDEAKLQEAKRKTYYCLYDEINKDMTKYSRLKGSVYLQDSCLEAFKHATQNIRKDFYTKEFDYKPLGWEEAILEQGCYSNLIEYSFR